MDMVGGVAKIRVAAPPSRAVLEVVRAAHWRFVEQPAWRQERTEAYEESPASACRPACLDGAGDTRSGARFGCGDLGQRPATLRYQSTGAQELSSWRVRIPFASGARAWPAHEAWLARLSLADTGRALQRAAALRHFTHSRPSSFRQRKFCVIHRVGITPPQVQEGGARRLPLCASRRARNHVRRARHRSRRNSLRCARSTCSTPPSPSA